MLQHLQFLRLMVEPFNKRPGGAHSHTLRHCIKSDKAARPKTGVFAPNATIFVNLIRTHFDWFSIQV